MELGHAAMRNLISAGLGASILPIEAVMGDASSAPVVIRRLTPPLTRTLAIIRRSDKPDDAALTHVHDALYAIKDRRLLRPEVLDGLGTEGKVGARRRARQRIATGPASAR